MSTRTAAERISSTTGYLMLRVGGAARDLVEQALGQWELAGRDLRVLTFAYGEERSQQELCRLAGMDRTTMVAVVDKLERLGYAHRVRSATDRRKHVVTLSPRGERAMHEVLERLEQVEADFLAPLSPAEQRQLNILVGRLFAVHNPACEPS